uniref:Putative secreted protein n=1 Tax=Anopheles triannulatus TaxID=58253 RepID=A0A2M4B3S0_9DIPT
MIFIIISSMTLRPINIVILLKGVRSMESGGWEWISKGIDNGCDDVGQAAYHTPCPVDLSISSLEYRICIYI